MDETPIDVPTATPAITRTLTLDAPATAVWDELTDAEALADWLGLVVDGSVTAGATGTHREAGIEREVHFLDVDVARGLSWRWGEDDDATTVSITLDTDGDTTTVTVTETRSAAASCSVAEARADGSFDAWDRRLLGLELRTVSRRAFATV
jgi:uncharacterized protein YndB with AHSA1/START domain